MSSVLTTQTNTNLQHLDNGHSQLSPSQYVQMSNSISNGESTMALHDILSVLLRRKISIIFIVFSILILTMMYTLSLPPTYKANAIIQIENEGSQIVSFGRTSGGPATASFDGDSSNDAFFRTRYELLRSRVLFNKVIQELQLYDSLSPKIKKSSGSLLSSIAISLGLKDKQVSHSTKLIDYTSLFEKNIYILAVPKTHLVQIFYTAPSPSEAKKVVDSVIRNFIDIRVKSKSETGKYAKKFLADQLAAAKKRLIKSEENLIKYSNEKGILGVDDRQTRDVTRLVNLDAALVQAKIRRIQAESLYREMQRAGSVSTVLNNAAILSLKSNLVGLESNYQEMLKTFKPNYPDMVRLQQQINTVRGRLNTERNNIQRSLEADYLSAKRQEDRLTSEIKNSNKKIFSLQNSSIDYNTLKREVETNGQLYNGLLRRYEEVNVASAVNTSSITIVEPAVLPLEKASPKPKNNMVIALFVGLLLGLAFAFLREALDRTINSSEELERFSGLPVLGKIPKISTSVANKHMQALSSGTALPRSTVVEAYRSTSTNIRFMLQSQENRVLLVTSAHPNEGKTTTAINMAHTYAQMGQKVLLVDANIRNPSIHANLYLSNKLGLSHYLKGEVDLVGITQPVKKIPGLYAITAGSYEIDPIILISNERMSYLTTQGSSIFDYVIIDAPPVDGFSDTLILSSLASSTILVTKEGSIESTTIKRILNQLNRVRNNILGFMVIGIKKPSVSKKNYSKNEKKALKLIKQKSLALKQRVATS